MAYPSTYADLQSAVTIRARLDPINDAQKAKDWINRAYTRVCLDAELLITTGTMAMTTDAYSYTLPSAIGRIKSMYVTPAGQTDIAGEQPPMLRVPFEDILARRANGRLVSQSGRYSTHYALVGSNVLEVWPTPAAADVISVWFAGFPTALTNASDLPQIEEPYASDLLEYGALVYAGDLLGDPSMDDWKSSFQQTMGEYMAHLDAKGGDIPSQFHQWGTLRDTREMYYGPGGYGG